MRAQPWLPIHDKQFISAKMEEEEQHPGDIFRGINLPTKKLLDTLPLYMANLPTLTIVEKINFCNKKANFGQKNAYRKKNTA